MAVLQPDPVRLAIPGGAFVSRASSKESLTPKSLTSCGCVGGAPVQHIVPLIQKDYTSPRQLPTFMGEGACAFFA